MQVVHLSDRDGDFAGTKPKADGDWNEKLIGSKDYYNSVRFADWRVGTLRLRL